LVIIDCLLDAALYDISTTVLIKELTGGFVCMTFLLNEMANILK